MALYEITRHLIEAHKLIPGGEQVVVAVSGGPDSITLLHILQRLRNELDFSLHVATLDHGLRGADGAADAQFVVDLCAQWDLPVTHKAIALPESSEDSARRARYAFLAEVARAQTAQYVAVGHHADDQAETVLLRLIRGTGLRGLAGMRLQAALPGDPSLTLLRPLLYAHRAEIMNYCQEQGLEVRQDATNQDLSLLRNRLRHEILPELRTINPQVDRALAQLADHAALNQDYLAAQLADAIAGAVQIQESGVSLSQVVFAALHPALQNQFVLWAVDQLGGQDLTALHVQQAVDLALRGQTGQRALLPGKLQLRLDYDTVVIERQGLSPDGDSMPLLKPGTLLEIAVPGQTVLPGSNWRLETSYEAFDTVQARIDTAGQALQLRTRQPGDRFAPPGLKGHHQKLKKWLIDHKVPQEIRDLLPIVVADAEIAAFFEGSRWIVSASFTPESGVETLIYLRFIKLESTQAN